MGRRYEGVSQGEGIEALAWSEKPTYLSCGSDLILMALEGKAAGKGTYSSAIYPARYAQS